MYILIAVIVFGILIVVHELGHFAAAKAFGVKVLEFSVGMGPRLVKWQGRETVYSLRALPIGGSCLMEGEDSEAEDPRAFTAQPRWKRFVILVSGALMNFLLGAVIVLLLVSGSSGFVGTTVTALAEGFPLEGEKGLMVGDTILSINGERLYYVDDFSNFMAIAGGRPVDLAVSRGGKTVVLEDFPLKKREYTEDGVKVLRYGITFNVIPATAGEKLKYAAYTTFNFVRLIRISLSELFSGDTDISQFSGPVGIVSAMNEVGKASGSISAALQNIAFIAALVAVNLAVMNLLPIPALDGGRIFFLVVTYLAEKVMGRRIDPKYEGYVHAAGFVLLMGLTAVVMVSDIIRIFKNG